MNIFTDASFKNRNESEPKKTATHDGFNFYNYGALKYKPKAITNAVLVNKGDLYSDLDRKRTYGYLSQLNSFKYPNIEYIENSIDSTLTPAQNQQVMALDMAFAFRNKVSSYLL